MISCPSCNNVFDTKNDICQKCGFSPQFIDGFEAWAPDLAHEGDGFHPEFHTALVKLEEGNFWFRARNRLIVWALKKYFPDFGSFLEVGCGTGFVLSGVTHSFPAVRLCGSEIFISGLKCAASRLPNATLVQMDARKIPYFEEFDVVAAFDVIEHIEEDQEALNGLYSALKPGGGLLLTVPQHSWLWSSVDDYSCHKRRYSYSGLCRKVEGAGFSLIRSTSFVSLLLPFMLASRVSKRANSDYKNNQSNESNLNPILNFIFGLVMVVEFVMIRLGVNFPLGGSRLVVALKK